jgi:uncharacterized repeat protein (TIGR03803 family)
LYGTTDLGGNVGDGTVFELDTYAARGKETVLHSFNGDDGVLPLGVFLWQLGKFYGTTYAGGDPTCGCGTVFSVETNGNLTTVHSFTGLPDGATPAAALIRDSADNLYGVTHEGGAYGYGAVFKLTP